MLRGFEKYNPEKKPAIDVENVEEVKKQIGALEELLDEKGYIGRKWSPEARQKLEAALAEGKKILEDLEKEKQE